MTPMLLLAALALAAAGCATSRPATVQSSGPVEGASANTGGPEEEGDGEEAGPSGKPKPRASDLSHPSTK